MREVTRTDWLGLRELVERSHVEAARVRDAADVLRSAAVEERIRSEDDRAVRASGVDARQVVRSAAIR